MRITHFIPHLGRTQGGAAQALANLVREWPREAADLSLYATPLPEDGEIVDLPPELDLAIFPARAFFGFRYSRPLKTSLAQPRDRHPDLVHSHLLWTHSHYLAARFARTCRAPHLVSPCGTLDPRALEHRSTKKALAAALFQRQALRQAACIHAQSEREQESIRAWGVNAPIALIPNIVTAPAAPHRADTQRYLSRLTGPVAKHHVLFLGRIHPAKNLAALLHAWARVAPRFPDWQVIFAGPDEDGHRTDLERLARKLGIAERLQWTGFLDAAEKWAALDAADLLVLPSRFENFGLAAAEALAMGTPVLASTDTPWQKLADAGAGLWVDGDDESLADGLGKLCSLEPAERKAMELAARELGERFAAGDIIEKWIQLYRWLAEKGPRPSCVVQ